MATQGPATERIGRTRDARGRPIKLLDPMPLYVLGRHDVIDAPTLERIAEALEPGVGGGRRRWLLSVVLGVGVLLLIGIAIAIEGRPAWSDLVSMLTNPAILVVLVGGVVAPIFTARRERLRRVRHIMLEHHRCPHCGYALDGLPCADDRTTVCPECGCAWRLDAPLARAAPERPRRRVWLLLIIVGLSALLAAGLVVYMKM
jgi:hypothetical protein